MALLIYCTFQQSHGCYVSCASGICQRHHYQSHLRNFHLYWIIPVNGTHILLRYAHKIWYLLQFVTISPCLKVTAEIASDAMLEMVQDGSSIINCTWIDDVHLKISPIPSMFTMLSSNPGCISLGVFNIPGYNSLRQKKARRWWCFSMQRTSSSTKQHPEWDIDIWSLEHAIIWIQAGEDNISTHWICDETSEKRDTSRWRV